MTKIQALHILPEQLVCRLWLLLSLFFLTHIITAQEFQFVDAVVNAPTCIVEGLLSSNDVAVSPDGKHVYVTGEVDDAIVILDRSPLNGTLIYKDFIQNGVNGIDALNSPTGITMSPDGSQVYVASYLDHAIVVLDRNEMNGALSFASKVEDSVGTVMDLQGAVSVAISPDGTNAYVAAFDDDALLVFSRNVNNGSLTLLETFKDEVSGINDLDGCRDVIISPDGANVYVTAFDDDALIVFDRDLTDDGRLTMNQTIKNNVNGISLFESPRSLIISPDGKNIYVTGFSQSALFTFDRNALSGSLTFSAVNDNDVKGPTGLVISPDGLNVFVNSNNTDQVSSFVRDSVTGLLTFGNSVTDELDGVYGLDGPRGIDISPDGKHIYSCATVDHALAVLSQGQPHLSLSMHDGIKDHSGHRYHGRTTPTVEFIDGPCGSGAVIGQTNEDVVFLPGQSMDGIDDFTISFYVKLDGLNNSNNIMSCANPTRFNELIIGYNQTITDKGFHIIIANQFYHFAGSQALLDDLSWHHVVVVRTGSQAILYVDGMPIGDPIVVTSAPLEVDPGGFVLGQDQDVVGGGFQGGQSLFGAIANLDIFRYPVDSGSIAGLVCTSCPTAGVPCDDGNTHTINDVEDGACNCLGMSINEPLISVHFEDNPDDQGPNQYEGCGNGFSYSNGLCGKALIIENNTFDHLKYSGQIIDGLGDFTLSFNAQINDNNSANTLISLANRDQADEFLVSYERSQGIIVTIDGISYVMPFTSFLLSDLSWHHLVLIREGHLLSLYVDGVDEPRTMMVSNKILKVDPEGFIIGQEQIAVNEGYELDHSWWGEIDQFRIFPFVLNEFYIERLDCTFCPLTRAISDDPIASDYYYADQTLTATGQILTPSEVKMQAGDNVVLGSDFSVESGALFEAEIDDCPLSEPIVTGYVADVDGNQYQTVKIGMQEWMAKNLTTTKYNDGTPIAEITNSQLWQTDINGAWCYYDNNANNESDHGRLYNWYAIENIKNVCPAGWKVPTVVEFKYLIDSIGHPNGGQLKEVGLDYWNSPNKDASNATGWSGRGSGYRQDDGTFISINNMANYWTQDEIQSTPTFAQYFILSANSGSLGYDPRDKGAGKSIRCLKE